MEKFGIQETKELLAFGFDIHGAVVASLDDGKISLADAPKFFTAFIDSPKAFGGANLIGKEILDMSEDEKQELVSFARDRFDLPDDMLEILIEDTLLEVLNLYRLSLRWAKRAKPAA